MANAHSCVFVGAFKVHNHQCGSIDRALLENRFPGLMRSRLLHNPRWGVSMTSSVSHTKE